MNRKDAPKFAPGPWYSKLSPAGERIVYDIHSQPLAQVFPDKDNRECQAATERLIRHAPSVFMTLRAVQAILQDDGGHADLVTHIERTLELVEPQRRIHRLDGVMRHAG